MLKNLALFHLFPLIYAVMSYQYNVEVVNVIPADALTVGSKDGTWHKLTLRCVRRDAVFDCTEVPASFEVRNAPDYDQLECALVSHEDQHTVLARATAPVVIGGPHRAVGAVWVPLEAVSPSVHSAEDSKANAARPTARVFIAWTMTTMDGSPLSLSCLEVPPSSIHSEATGTANKEERERGSPATSRTSAETSPANATESTHIGAVVTPVSVLVSSRHASATVSGDFSNEDTLPVGQGGDSSSSSGNNNSKPDSASLAAHVSIVLYEAQGEAAAQQQQQQQQQPRDTEEQGSNDDAQRFSSEPASTLHNGTEREERDFASAGEAQDVQPEQGVVFSQFPRCCVSTSPVAEKAADAASQEKAEATSSTSAFVDFYATSTQAIGDVSFEKRYRNLYLVPCPLLFDQIKADMKRSTAASGSKDASKAAESTSDKLWWLTHRHGITDALLGSASSAIEAIQLEHEERLKKRSNGSAAAEGSAPSSKTSNGPDRVECNATISGEAALTVLRQQALAAVRQRRVAYSM